MIEWLIAFAVGLGGSCSYSRIATIKLKSMVFRIQFGAEVGESSLL